MKKILGYARVNHAGDDDDRKMAEQVARLREAGASTIYEECGSGTATHNKELMAAMASLQRGDELLVVRLDRISRNGRWLLVVVDDLERRGVTITTTSCAGGNCIGEMVANVSLHFQVDALRRVRRRHGATR